MDDIPRDQEEFKSLLQAFHLLLVSGAINKYIPELTEEICYQIDNEINFRQYLIERKLMGIGDDV